MFTKSSQQNTFPEDYSNPNGKYQYARERYIEKKILTFIMKEDISLNEHRQLCFLTKLTMSDFPLICKDIWADIPICYEDFRKNQAQFIDSVNKRYSQTDAMFVFKPGPGSEVYLPEIKMLDFSERMRALLTFYTVKGYFDNADLLKMITNNKSQLARHAVQYRYATPSELQQKIGGPDYVPSVAYFRNEDHYTFHKHAKDTENQIDKLKDLLICMRSFQEYNESDVFQCMEEKLAKEFSTIDESIFGFDLLKIPGNNLTKEHIQLKLNQFLLAERNPKKLPYWVSKGAQINAIGEHGMTILGVFLSEYRYGMDLNSTIPWMIESGLDVNLGINNKSGKNNLIMALNHDRPSISCETINRMIAHATKETINYQFKGWNALHEAVCRAERLDCVRQLLEKGASLQIKSLDGRTPLLAAIASDNIDAVRLILNHDLDTLDFQDKKGTTPLMRAITPYGMQKNTLQLIDLLIIHGANLDLVNRDGKTAGQLSAWNKAIEAQFNCSVESRESAYTNRPG